MNVAIYKPNSKNTGYAFSFRVSTQGKLPVFYVNAIQQHSWDDKKKTGSFIKNKDADDKNVSFKLNDFELGEILSSMTSRVPWNSYHSFNDNTTMIRFAPWDKPRKIKGKDGAEQTFKSPAFGLSVTRNGNQNYRIAIEPGETEVLKALIKKYFQVVFDVKQQQDEAYRADAGNSKPATKPAQKPETSVNIEEDEAPF
tara:strand:- start:624 stop:1217 length:594 start_codon:yes stop_codon:yes gene_type:complete